MTDQVIGWAHGRAGGSASFQVFDAEGVDTGRVVVLFCGETYLLRDTETLVRRDLVHGHTFFEKGAVSVLRKADNSLVLRHRLPQNGSEVRR